MCSLQQKPRLKETSSIWYTETWPFFKFVSDSKKTISWNASKNVMVSSRNSRAKVREGKKPFEVSVVVQQRVVVHTAVKIWKTYKLIYVQCLCLTRHISKFCQKKNKSQSYLRIIAQNFKEWRFFKKLIILALFFLFIRTLCEYIHSMCVCFLEV